MPITPLQRRVSVISFAVLLALVIYFCARMVSPYLLAVMMGGITTVILYPLHLRLQARGVGPKTSATLCTLGLVLVIIVPIFLLSTSAMSQGAAFLQSLTNHDIQKVERSVDEVKHGMHLDFLERFGLGDPVDRLSAAGSKVAGEALVAFAVNVPDALLQLALYAIAIFFLLLDGPRFVRWIGERLPLDIDVQAALFKSFCTCTVRVIWASVVAAAAQAAVILVGFAVLRVPGLALATGATFLLAWVPVVGTAPVWLIGAGWLYSQGSLARALAMLGVGVLCSLADNVVRPFVIKGENCHDLHPLVSLVAIFGGLEMFGFIGVIVGPILAAVLVYLLQIWPIVAARLGYHATPVRPLEPEVEARAKDTIASGLPTAAPSSP